jgi:hypothetical protein
VDRSGYISEDPDLPFIIYFFDRDCKFERLRLWAMVFNATFNNISAISWRSVFIGGETREPGENHRSVASH